MVVDRALPDGLRLTILVELSAGGPGSVGGDGLPDTDLFEAQAIIAWTARKTDGMYRVGLRFGAVAADERRRLDRFLARLERARRD